MALGTPVISTSKGVQGLDVRDGEHVLIADEPLRFADKVIELLRSADLRSRLAAGGRRLIAARYDSRAAGQTVSSLVERIGVLDVNRPTPTGKLAAPPVS
jgi:glycosyltransferase involved in cell wall biosynthesis